MVFAIWKYDFLRRTPRTVLSAHSRHQLTRREREVTVLLLEGQSYKETAAHLGISTNTVKTHVEHIYEKAGVSSRAQLSADLMSLAKAPWSSPPQMVDRKT
ncbi:MAG: helix-turn-helix transcriptional regulator [Alkalispirochaeta sp.]